MGAFVIYDPSTGLLRGAYSVSHAADIATVMAANTPPGLSALPIDQSHAVAIDQNGWKVVDGALTEIVPSPADLLAAAQTTQNNAIEAAYQNATFQTAIGYMNTTFWTDQNSQTLLTGALTVFTPAGAVPDGFQWWDATNTGVAMNLAQLQGLAQTIMGRVNTNFIKRKSLLATIAAATTIAEVQAVVW